MHYAHSSDTQIQWRQSFKKRHAIHNFEDLGKS